MSGAIGVAQLEAKQAKMTAEQTRLIFREADHHADRHADKAALDTLPVPAGAVSVVINQKSSVYEGVTARCATERIKRNSVSSRSSTSNAALGAAALPTHPTQTAWLANASSRSARQCVGLESASSEAVGAVAMNLRVAALAGSLAPHIPPLITAWSTELAEQHRRLIPRAAACSSLSNTGT